MYGFLLLLAAGIFIYAKIDDRKEQKRQEVDGVGLYGQQVETMQEIVKHQEV